MKSSYKNANFTHIKFHKAFLPAYQKHAKPLIFSKEIHVADLLIPMVQFDEAVLKTQTSSTSSNSLPVGNLNNNLLVVFDKILIGDLLLGVHELSRFPVLPLGGAACLCPVSSAPWRPVQKPREEEEDGGERLEDACQDEDVCAHEPVVVEEAGPLLVARVLPQLAAHVDQRAEEDGGWDGAWGEEGFKL